MDNIGYLLMKVSKDLRYALTEELKVFNLTASQWAVLKRLEMEEEHNSSLLLRTAVEIAAKLDFDKPTMSGIVNRLVEKGMIKKERHPVDKRVFILSLSSEAKSLIPTLESASNRVMNESLVHFSIEEKELFLTLLTKLDHTLSRGGKK
ncbi:MarR family winged helix-turn-helix transcriptional regulator [Bacillus sp. MRMR6]|uniref:MarR family winged helix-turn-helix transcriptional regulator n=1 Tax=Bacillus sp. MRMR6 TaxID=1928617 RepID=UPI0009523DFF|nr:MarR family transcriptional regulator [Bacillus sp. MRMR6]OLS40043.1 hypothetical protein BTR25_11235 [Bacillus sp. MRMR6]